MQYLIHDIQKLPLVDRLALIEKVISSMKNENAEQHLLEIIKKQTSPAYH